MAKRSQVSMPKPARAPAKVAPKKASNSRNLLLVVIGGVVVVAVGLVLLIMQTVNKPASATARVGEGTAWGPKDAIVTIVDFSDFGCVHCRNFALNQGEQLRSEYEATGKVRFEFKHFIIGGATTAAAANAAECAADQGRFWDYHNLLFSRQGTSSAPFSNAALKQYAVQLGLDTALFNQCVDSSKHLEKVYRDAAEGRGLGVNATPTFFVNGQKLEGAVPYSTMKATVDAILNAAQ